MTSASLVLIIFWIRFLWSGAKYLVFNWSQGAAGSRRLDVNVKQRRDCDGYFSTAGTGKSTWIDRNSRISGQFARPRSGGIIIGLAGWHMVFFINLPVGIIGYVMAQIILSKDKPREEKESFDFAGALLFTLGIITLLLGVNNGKG